MSTGYSKEFRTNLGEETPVKILYSVIWMYVIFRPLQRRVYEYVRVFLGKKSMLNRWFFRRFPKSLPLVILDYLERLYLFGFVLLQVFVMVLPFLTRRTKQNAEAVSVSANRTQGIDDPTTSDTGSMEFLPLMLTSIYCAIGLVWAFLRLSYIYLKQR